MPKEILKSIISSGIVIHWDHSNEYIPLDLDNINELSSIPQTHEDWYGGTDGEFGGGDAIWVSYNPKSSIKKLNDNEIKITLKYSKEESAVIKNPGVPWGTSSVTLNLKDSTGFAMFDDPEDTENIGDNTKSKVTVITNWESERQRQKVSQNQRDSTFRKTILGLDKRCVLTGEDYDEVLDAAHIKAVTDGGLEILNNGIMLRTDLHRLYDAGGFNILPDGNIQVIDGTPKSYQDLLAGKSIPESTLKRVHEALLELTKPEQL